VSIKDSPLKVPHITMGQDKIITPFGPMIYQTFLSDAEIESLLTEGSRLNQEENDYAFNLAGNMKNGRSFQYGEDFKDSFAPVVMDRANKFMKGVSDVFNFGLPQPHNLSLLDLWINYQKPNDFNPFHVHSHFLSFVIYCDVPESIFEVQADSNQPVAGQIAFHYGEVITPLSNPSYIVKPENNLMYLFPARLQHVVYPFYADGTRVSVAGNISCDYSI